MPFRNMKHFAILALVAMVVCVVMAGEILHLTFLEEGKNKMIIFII